ncbi:unnamed protein product [Acanthoscelides obtectus]|uniref:Hexosyltransferase n=2 Tax=Acanthoscelides obtectus TaxID=200917 RepID=A0A9P0PD53_ACAOB|nr:unnamed protein product [Acanthoscelides obtectus]CAK1656933.1 Acetylgalactosaminyl-O-glycosyl-glycoprotein beta-1,3-N-acetylglucosaminyltransferase [Acanthoscelides obtectus]
MSFNKLRTLLYCTGATFIFLLYLYLEKLGTYKIEEQRTFYPPSNRSFLRNTSDGYHKLLNIHFRYKHIPEWCNTSDRYVIAVLSSPDHLENRNVIRLTWGQKALGIKVFFLIANTTDETLQLSINRETLAFRDIVQGDFLDSYKNLSYKHVMALKMVVDNCPNVKYLVKVDDDTFVNTPNLKKFLDQYDQNYGNSSNLLCNTMEYSPALRDGRWKVSVEMFPEEYYPKYCSGYFIIYPMAAISAIYRESQNENVKFLWVDDAFVSGVLAGKARINHTSIRKLSLNYVDITKFMEDFKEFGGRPFLVGRMNLNTEDLKKLWAFLKDHVPKTNILERLELHNL